MLSVCKTLTMGLLLIITACYILNQTIFAATTDVDCEQSLSGDRKKGGTAQTRHQ